ncbi:group III truncated hemoglobin [Kordiimonas aestuarii]|uniref:group III truncated hemoglobin n=1 Tax=Kordiimonas aestuarii TaxID=1005925 RepID=UPI0021D2759F|nr:group III truncated hemoglobin [Kordiimonas aestuarii]
MPADSKPTSPDRAVIHAFVVAFYARLRKHHELGPIFEHHLGSDWDAHMERLTDFWITMLGGGTLYRGNPFEVHRKIDALREHQFTDWLALFSEAAADTLPDDQAKHACERANRIAESLKMGLFYRPKGLSQTAPSSGPAPDQS